MTDNGARSAHVVREAGFPRAAVAVFPSDAAVHRTNSLGTFTERFELHRERVVAIEMREGVDAVAQALDEVVKLRVCDNRAVGFQERRCEETKRDA
jgi:hypothetical protein